jgi:phage-related minor tail protein
MGGSLKKFAGIAAAGFAGVILAVGSLSFSFSEDLQKSLNGVQAATGVADDMMGDMRDTMLAIYNNNFGESFEEIGAAMTLISQQTGLAGKALQSMTENALAIKDTFGIEVADSIRGANQLMKQFGLDGNTAYNLIVQGAQGGLNANGDLIDTLNEYSGTFAAQGFSAEEMFNMLSNGAESGVRDVDLLADAVKEFGIRSKDGSDASIEAFQALGLNSNEMTNAFARGGEVGKAAFDKTTAALIAITDPVAQNAAGVALFGTQFEDLGIKGIAALVSTEGEINKNIDALDKINKVKYDTLGEAMEGIRRNLLTGIFIPLEKKIMPKMNEFVKWIKSNIPTIKNEIEFAFNIIGKSIEKVGTILQNTKNFFKDHWSVVEPILAGIAAGAIIFGAIKIAIEAWTAVTKIATIAQTALNTVMNLSPMGKIILIIGLLVAAGVALYRNWDKIKAGAVALGAKISQIWEGIKTATNNVWNGIVNTVKNSINTISRKINKLIRGANKISGKIGGPQIPEIPMLAKGTNFFKGGAAIVGERGPELVNLPRGSKVIPNDKSMEILGQGQPINYEGMFSGAIFNVRSEIDVKLIAREIFNLQQSRSRASGVVYG